VYRLLIVTRDKRVEQMFSSMQGWENMGFKQPRLRATVADALECMQKHHIDAIAIDNEPDYTELEQWLDVQAPDMPIFSIAPNADKQLEIVREVELLLNQIHSDDSNDDKNEGYYFKMARERWQKRLLSGLAPSAEYIFEHERMYRCVDDPQKPCVYARMSIPEGDSFITSRWHYGSERLGTALKNFFGETFEQHPILLAVVSPEEVRVAVCPRRGGDERELSLPRAQKYIEETVEQIQNYLGLTLTVSELHMQNGLADFAAEYQRHVN
jgi:hypothetical protein